MRKIYHFSGLLLGGTANQHITPTLSPRRQKKMTRAIAVWTLAAPLRRPMAASPTSSPADFSTWMTLEVAIGLMKANGGLWQRLNPSTPHIKQKKTRIVLMMLSRIDESCKNWLWSTDKTIGRILIYELLGSIEVCRLPKTCTIFRGEICNVEHKGLGLIFLSLYSNGWMIKKVCVYIYIYLNNIFIYN